MLGDTSGRLRAEGVELPPDDHRSILTLEDGAEGGVQPSIKRECDWEYADFKTQENSRFRDADFRAVVRLANRVQWRKIFGLNIVRHRRFHEPVPERD